MRTKRLTLCVVFTALTALSLSVRGSEELLREAWRQAGGPKASELAHAEQSLQNLADQWQALRDPCAHPEFQWLVAHPEAAYLALDEAFARQPKNGLRDACLAVAARIHRAGLGQYLPALLRTAATPGERLKVLQCMAALHDRHSVQEAVRFSGQLPQNVTEPELVAVVRLFASAPTPAHLGFLQRFEPMMRSLEARFHLARAQYLCGDVTALQRVPAILLQKEAGRELKLRVVEFLQQNFGEVALQALSRCALSDEDEQVAARALAALICASGYERSSAPVGRQEPAAERPGGQKPPDAPAGEQKPPIDAAPGELPARLHEIDAQQRRELVGVVLDWWATEGRKQFEQKRREPEVSARPHRNSKDLWGLTAALRPAFPPGGGMA